jgi:hypothetical protein
MSIKQERKAWLAQANKGWRSAAPLDAETESNLIGRLCENNLELDQTGSFQDVFESSRFKDGLNEVLPLPAKFARWKSMPVMSVITECCRGAIVSLSKPHIILAASAEFLNTLRANPNDVCGKNMDAFLSPSTDLAAIQSAIHGASLLRTTQIKLALLATDGRDVEATVSLSPHRAYKDGRLEGCLLQIESVDHVTPVFLVEDFGRCASAVKTDREVHRQLRREANQTAGKENEQERQRQQGARRSSSQPT